MRGAPITIDAENADLIDRAFCHEDRPFILRCREVPGEWLDVPPNRSDIEIKQLNASKIISGRVLWKGILTGGGPQQELSAAFVNCRTSEDFRRKCIRNPGRLHKVNPQSPAIITAPPAPGNAPSCPYSQRGRPPAFRPA